MSDIMTQTEDQTASQLDELSMLKQRAQIMGIQFSNNIGIDTLRERINAKMEGISPVVDTTAVVNPLAGEVTVQDRVLSERERQMRDELKLIRLRITNMDPKKRGLPGEIFTVANEYVGTVKKYVPFGEVTDDGYHVPFIIYRQLEARKFLDIRVVKGATGQPLVKHAWVKEFSLDVLPPLTKEELAALATAQAAAGVFAND